MKKIVTACIIFVGIFVLGHGTPASAADNLQMRPLQYRETLDVGQQKKGVVDVANGSDDTAQVALTVRFFKQVGDDGTLEFYDRPDETDGITLDIDSVELKGKESARIGFTVDSSKLPQGDVFAVIFATTVHQGAPQTIVPSVQVGTLLLLQNGKVGPRSAAITDLKLGIFQFGDKVKGTVAVKNPANSASATGFFPAMKVAIGPWGAESKFEGPLVYAGRTRSFDFSVPSNQFGIYKVTVVANNATETRYVFLITGVWRYVVPGLLVLLLIIGIVFVAFKKVRSARSKK
ncbi:hypothetical protein HY312_01645 [Candidatus Saccharibacteria bacterium]|nr:hypothetical protein [Candidatus Saccharibacteria bacterium]